MHKGVAAEHRVHGDTRPEVLHAPMETAEPGNCSVCRKVLALLFQTCENGLETPLRKFILTTNVARNSSVSTATPNVRHIGK